MLTHMCVVSPTVRGLREEASVPRSLAAVVCRKMSVAQGARGCMAERNGGPGRRAMDDDPRRQLCRLAAENMQEGICTDARRCEAFL